MENLSLDEESDYATPINKRVTSLFRKSGKRPSMAMTREPPLPPDVEYMTSIGCLLKHKRKRV